VPTHLTIENRETTSPALSSYSRPPFTGRPDWLGSRLEYNAHIPNETAHPLHDALRHMPYPPQPFFVAQPDMTSPEEPSFMAPLPPPIHRSIILSMSTSKSSLRQNPLTIEARRDLMALMGYDGHGCGTSKVSAEARSRSHSRHASEPFTNIGGYQISRDTRMGERSSLSRTRRNGAPMSLFPFLRLKSSKACHRENCRKCDRQERGKEKERVRTREKFYRAFRDSHRPRESSKLHKRSSGVTIVVNNPGAAVTVGPSRSRTSRGSKDVGTSVNLVLVS
jgi:hypothetical protein